MLDYQQVVSLLHDYSKPRDRISTFLASGDLVRVRKGLYVVGESYRRGPVLRELLANLIYGPSYVSLDYALNYHGLIPERVEDVTSVTTGKSRSFQTPFGIFSYRPLPPERYAPGITFAGEAEGRFLIACPEKALVDKVWCDKRLKPARLDDFAAYLFEDLRVDAERLAALDQARLETIAAAFASRKIDMLVRFIGLQRGTSHE
ncbi:MAG: hypothetical protein V1929_13965 [bacterium]